MARPPGRISDDDRGPGKIQIRSYGPSPDAPAGVCVIQFPPATTWVGLPPADLESFIGRLQEHLATLRVFPPRCPAQVAGGRCAGLDGHEGEHYAHARDRKAVR
jgi:hypothetical protein